MCPPYLEEYWPIPGGAQGQPRVESRQSGGLGWGQLWPGEWGWGSKSKASRISSKYLWRRIFFVNKNISLSIYIFWYLFWFRERERALTLTSGFGIRTWVAWLFMIFRFNSLKTLGSCHHLTSVIQGGSESCFIWKKASRDALVKCRLYIMLNADTRHQLSYPTSKESNYNTPGKFRQI